MSMPNAKEFKARARKFTQHAERAYIARGLFKPLAVYWRGGQLFKGQWDEPEAMLHDLLKLSGAQAAIAGAYNENHQQIHVVCLHPDRAMCGEYRIEVLSDLTHKHRRTGRTFWIGIDQLPCAERELDILRGFVHDCDIPHHKSNQVKQ